MGSPAYVDLPLVEAIGIPGTLTRAWDGERFVDASWDEVASRADRAAAGLRALGVDRGTRVACILTNSLDVCIGLLGIWLAGGVPVSLPTPGRGMPLDEYARQLQALAEQSRARLMLVEPMFAEPLAAAASGGLTVKSFDALAAPGTVEHCAPRGDDEAFIQYSSGSTTSPKGCVLTARAILTHTEMLGSTLGIGKDDRGAMWLPLSHDMGLFGGLLMAWARGMAAQLSTPQRFLATPRTWMRDLSAWRATFTVGPNFGLRIAARAARRPEELEPFPLRACIVGSDRVEFRALEEAATALAPYGFTFDALTPAYGLAEATLAVTTTAAEDGPTALAVDAEGLLMNEVREVEPGSPATTLVSSGRPLPGVGVRIDSDDPTAIGEVCVRSLCLARGYVASPERSASTFRDGELRTGDLGFLRDGELYVVGRTDDLISVGGRNVYASEIESELGLEEGVRRGNCVVLESLEGDGAHLMIVAEPADEGDDLDAVATRVRAAVATRSGMGASEVVFLPRGALPKTASGKVQRYRLRQLIQSAGFEPLAQMRFGPPA